MKRFALSFLIVTGCQRAVTPPNTSDASAAPQPTPPALITSATVAPTDVPSKADECEENAVVPASVLGWTLSGSFTAPGADEVFASIECPREGYRQNYALVRRTAEGLRIVRHLGFPDHRVHYADCATLRRGDGRDLAICRCHGQAYGEIFDSVVSIDFTSPEEDLQAAVIVEVKDTVETACKDVHEIALGKIDGFQVRDLDGDGTLDVRVKLRTGHMRVSSNETCWFGWENGAEGVPRPPYPAARTVDFIARGADFEPTPKSRSTLHDVEIANAIASKR